MSEAIVFTSGKGGVGKTTVISNIGVELSQLDKKVIMLDTDMGLRNLDLVMGIEDKVNYNILDILNRSCRIRQAIIRNKKYPNLYVIPAAPSMDTLCSYEARFKILIEELKASFDYCLIDSPAGSTGLLPHALLPVRTGGGDRGPGDSVAPPPRHRRLLHLPHDAELRNDP